MKTEVGISQELTERAILLVRGHKVMLDEDLAELMESKSEFSIKP